MATIIGKPIDRMDAVLKVTGGARYAAEERIDNLAYGVMVQSTIGKGRITRIDTAVAERAPGVLLVMTPFNAPRLADAKASGMQPGEFFPLLQDDSVKYNGQHIAMVVAETFEQATHAATLLDISYAAEAPVARLEQALDQLYVPQHFRGGMRPPNSSRGKPEDAFASAAVKLDVTYTTPIEHHNPMEPHAVIAVWEKDGALTLYHSTQSVSGSRDRVAGLLGVPKEKVHVVSRYVGGGFGTKGSTWPHVTLAAMAARQAGRPVKLVLTRRQMYSSNGYRAETIQRFRIGAEPSGRLVALLHDTRAETATLGEFAEPAGLATEMMYACANVAVTHRVANINMGIPTFMRAPGEASGMAGLEGVMDELAYAVNVDPLQLRILNHAERDEHEDKPWSSKSLLQCYQKGADAFGWSRRSMAPGSMRQGDILIGWGMASATYPTNRSAAGAHRAPPRRRQRRRPERNAGHRHRHLYHHAAGRRGGAGVARRARAQRARRFDDADRAGVGRLADRGECHAGGASGGARGARSDRAAGARPQRWPVQRSAQRGYRRRRGHALCRRRPVAPHRP